MSPTFADVAAAAERLRGVAAHTPMIHHPDLDAAIGGRAFVKCETHQPIGAFKLRGAYNRIALIPEAERAAGVIAYSSGNHAQGVAWAARALGLPACIVMPNDAPPTKLARTRALGAEVILYDRPGGESREALGEKLLAERGGTLVRPYDDAAVIAGQGTAGLEMVGDAAAEGAAFDLLLVCCGGGGLTAGCALAFAEKSPETRVFAVEPEYYDDTARSLAAGARLAIAADAPPSICDAVVTPMPGALTFPINQRLLAGALAVSDEAVRAAMRFAFHTLKTVVEPGGALALAAALTGAVATQGQTVGIVLSGGNVDPALYAESVA